MLSATRQTAGSDADSDSGSMVRFMSARRSKYGPEPKGVRQQFTVRLPVDVLEAVKERATREGLPVCDVISNALATVYGLPLIAQPRNAGFELEELALGKAS